MEKKEELIFQEVQPFSRQPVFWIAGVSMLFFLWILYQQDLLFDWVAIFYVFTVLVFFVFLFIARLETRISKQRVKVRMFPFQRKWREYDWSEVTTAEVIQYSPIRDYGGWGIRHGGRGTAYNVSGKMGLQLTMKNGKQYMIGTQLPDEIGKCIQV